MLCVSHSLMRLVLTAGLVVGLVMFVGCDSGSEGGGGDDTGGSSSTDGGNSNAGGGGDAGGNGSGGGGSVAIDHGSPEALFNSLLRAAEARDFQGVVEAYPPSARDEMAMGMVAISTMTMMSPSTDKDAIRAVLEKHGISEADLPAMGPQMQQEAQALSDGIANKTAFIGDMMGTLPEVQADAMRSFGVAEGVAVDSISLSDIQIDGDSASAKVQAAGQEGGEERQVNFVREDGNWYMGLDG